ncbi:MAG: Na/Pi symporter [Synergistaceae bacterium]|jgi:Na/Pi-cotransporter|nr:Na/Pi symporter [Synergistaceae bacterium]
MFLYFYPIINLLGGICLFLYGASQATEAFRSAFGARAREAMSRFAQRKPQAMIFGILLAAITQGSTVSSSIAISFADVGMLSLAGAVVVTMGASVGGTFVTFLISLDIVSFSPLFLTVSFLMTRFGNSWVRKIGNVLQALSLILLGMFLLKLGAEPLLNDTSLRHAVLAIALRPWTMFFAAVFGTAILQSSASVMALAVTIAMTGALPQSAVFPVSLGSHLGSTVAMLLAAAGGRRNARVLGVATFLYKLAGVLAFLPCIPWANAFLARLGFSMPTNIVLSQVLLVLLNAAIFYPWPQILVHGSSFLLTRVSGAGLREPVYLDDDLLEIPSLAVHLLAREMIRLTNYIEALLQMQFYPEKGGNDLKNLLPDGIQDLTEACEQYMYAIQPPSIAEDRATVREYRTISYAMLSLRETSRLATGRLAELFREYRLDILAEEVGKSEWNQMTALFMETVRDAFHAFALGDADLAQEAIERSKEFEKFTSHLRGRLLEGETGRRGNSAVMDFATVARRFLHAAQEVVRGDVFAEWIQTESKNGEKGMEHFG